MSTDAHGRPWMDAHALLSLYVHGRPRASTDCPLCQWKTVRTVDTNGQSVKAHGYSWTQMDSSPWTLMDVCGHKWAESPKANGRPWTHRIDSSRHQWTSLDTRTNAMEVRGHQWTSLDTKTTVWGRPWTYMDTHIWTPIVYTNEFTDMSTGIQGRP